MTHEDATEKALSISEEEAFGLSRAAVTAQALLEVKDSLYLFGHTCPDSISVP